MTTPKKAPDPETLERPQRRRYTAEFKMEILAMADRAAPGELEPMLRQHGLYRSYLTKWRAEQDCGTLEALAKKRGPKADPRQAEFDRLSRENAKLRRTLEVAELIIEAQKKTSELLGIVLDPTEPLSKD